jgi:fatty acid desaturase
VGVQQAGVETIAAPPTGRILTKTELQALSRPSDLRGAVRLGVHVLFLAAGGVLVALAHGWLLLPAMIVLGIAQAALFAPVHETVHLTAFASRRANAVAGWLCACPSLLNWHFYTAFHIAHHRFTQDPARDPELMAPPPGTLDRYILRIVALPYWRTRLTVLWQGWTGGLRAYPFVTARNEASIVRSIRLMTVAVLALAGLSMAVVGWWAPLAFWLGPQLLGQPFLRLYLLVEHTGCSEDANGLTNTRTTLTHPLVRLVMWNMSFHAEHHLYPSIPFHRLPAAHEALRARLGVIQNGYARWHVGFLRQLRA